MDPREVKIPGHGTHKGKGEWRSTMCSGTPKEADEIGPRRDGGGRVRRKEVGKQLS